MHIHALSASRTSPWRRALRVSSLLGALALLPASVQAQAQPPAAAASVPGLTSYVLTAPPFPASNDQSVKHTIKATWDTSIMQLQNVSSIGYPQGWTLWYQSPGNISTTPPTDLTTVNGLITTGKIISEGAGGPQGNTQLIRIDSVVTAVPPPPTLMESYGWRFTFDPNDPLQVYDAQRGAEWVWCHTRIPGVQCPKWPNNINVSAGQQGTAIRNRTYVHSAEIVGFVTTDHRLLIASSLAQEDPNVSGIGGYMCIANITGNATLCPTPFYPLTGTSDFASKYNELYYTASVNNKVYVLDFFAHQLQCFDSTINAPCVGENNWPVPEFGKAADPVINAGWAEMFTDNNRIYGIISTVSRYSAQQSFNQSNTVASGDLMVNFCYDTTLKGNCAGWNGAKDFHTLVPLTEPYEMLPFFIPVSKDGVTIDYVCDYVSFNQNYTCWDRGGNVVQPSSTLLTALRTTISQDGSNSVATSVIAWGKTYWNTTKQMGCYDPAKDQNCWSTPTVNNNLFKGRAAPTANLNDLLTLTPDPLIPGCMWAETVNNWALTINVFGSQPVQGCGALPNTIANFTSAFQLTRLGCLSQNPKAALWRFQFSGATGATSAALTVVDASNKPIPGWSNVPAVDGGNSSALSNGSAAWDLTSLKMPASGLPQFQIAINGLTAMTPLNTSLIASVTPAQLCWNAITLNPANPPYGPGPGPGPNPNFPGGVIDNVPVIPGYVDPSGHIVVPVPPIPTLTRITHIELR